RTGLRSARARRVDGVAAPAVRLRPLAGPERAADGDAHSHGPESPPQGRAGAHAESGAASVAASAAALVSRLPLRRSAAGTIPVRGGHGPATVLAGVECAGRR